MTAAPFESESPVTITQMPNGMIRIKLDETEAVQDDSPMDYGTIQRFQLAERLRDANPHDKNLALFDEPAEVQQFWLRIADEAVAVLVEEPRNERR